MTHRRSRGVFGRTEPPADPRRHGELLRAGLRAARAAAEEALGGYDKRCLIKIELKKKVSPEDVAKAASGIQVVSQEDGKLVLAFAAEEQIDAFEARLASLAAGRDVTYQNLLYALQGFAHWTPDDRTGWALKNDGFPDEEPFVIDAELWTLDRGNDSARLRDAFESWVAENGGQVIDAVRRPYLMLYRIRCTRMMADNLLRHRDVRLVDLPPRIGLERALIFTDVQELGEVPVPPETAPGVVVLDSGLTAGHPVLAPAVGDAQSFLPGESEADEHGHGTFVSGIALYDDVAECIRNRSFAPELRLFSGRILDDRNEAKPRFIENQVEEAVRYFVENYNCRVFNLSYGNPNKPYQGRHVAGLAVTLDALSRELDVLFVVPTGNYNGDDDGPEDWRAEYPRYLTGETSTLLDPAPALNALTVGSLARYERGAWNEQWPNDLHHHPVARADQPSPFTRHGPSVNEAIKPDLVDYGGNVLVNVRAGGRLVAGPQGVGELSTSRDFVAGRPFAEDSGTSYAAPRVANAAAKILGELPAGSVDLCRALLVSHARTPAACNKLFTDDAGALRNVTGYGLVDRSALYRSVESCVTLWAEESIKNRRHHFYEVPVPDEFWSQGGRSREMTIALAFRPPVRTTRIDYRAVAISFKLVPARSLDDVAQSFNAAIDRSVAPTMKERASGRRISEQDRSRGTVQASTWTFRQPSRAMRQNSWFVVVTRNDPIWGENLSFDRESYALTITLSDRSAEQPRLYTRIEARHRARIQARTKR